MPGCSLTSKTPVILKVVVYEYVPDDFEFGQIFLYVPDKSRWKSGDGDDRRRAGRCILVSIGAETVLWEMVFCSVIDHSNFQTSENRFVAIYIKGRTAEPGNQSRSKFRKIPNEKEAEMMYEENLLSRRGMWEWVSIIPR